MLLKRVLITEYLEQFNNNEYSNTDLETRVHLVKVSVSVSNF